MAKHKISKDDGHHLEGSTVLVDTQIEFGNTLNPEIDTTGGDMVWKAKTGTSRSFVLQENGNDVLILNSTLGTVSIISPYVASGFNTRNVVSSPVTTPYPIAADEVVVWDCTTENKVVNLPAAATSNGVRVDIKKIDASANTLTVDGNAAETIDGGLTAVLTTQYEAISMVCDGSNWHIIANFV